MEDQQQSPALAIEALNTTSPVSLLAAPLEYIFADHFRQRTLCRILDELADEAEADMDKVAAALRFLQTDFGLHVLDKEEDLFPLLRRRAEPEDKIEDVIAQLSLEHAGDKIDADEIIEGLAGILSATTSKEPAPGFRDLLKRFAANERRHLILENAIVLPLARARLTEGDLVNMGKRMAARRGLQYGICA